MHVLEILFKDVKELFGVEFGRFRAVDDMCAFGAHYAIGAHTVRLGSVPGRTDHTPAKRRSNSVGVGGVDGRDDILWLVYIAHVVAKKQPNFNVLKRHQFVCDACEM